MNKRVFLFVIISIFGLYTISCDDTTSESKYPSDNSERITIQKGVWGDVWFWEGNFMPSPDNSSNGVITPVVREIFIYEATSLDSVIIIGGGGFYSDILTEKVATLESEENGFFQIELSPGKYSFFIKEDTLYYANGIDSSGHILAATVTSNSVVKRQINITYNASY